MMSTLFPEAALNFYARSSKAANLPRSPTGFHVEGRAILFQGEPSPTKEGSVQILENPDTPSRSLAVIRGFLSPGEVEILAKLPSERNVEESVDRRDELPMGHRAFNVERPVRLWEPKVYHRLVNSIWNADKKVWGKIGEGYKLYTDLEYIECDMQRPTSEGHPGLYCDNDGILTMIVLLSEPSSVQGGTNFFESGTVNGRRLDLKMGDAVIYNSGECEHWITPVTEGCRKILQMELNEGDNCWSNLNLATFCLLVASTCACFHILTEHVLRIFVVGFIATLLFAYSIFGLDRLQPGLRASPRRQALVFFATTAGYLILATMPNAIQYYYDVHYFYTDS